MEMHQDDIRADPVSFKSRWNSERRKEDRCTSPIRSTKLRDEETNTTLSEEAGCQSTMSMMYEDLDPKVFDIESWKTPPELERSLQEMSAILERNSISCAFEGT
jgi:hypothetical protein